jgi:hypothetical protein
VATLAGPGMASPGRRMAQWLRVVVLGQRGGGVSRQRAFDAFRLGFGSGSIRPRYAPIASTVPPSSVVVPADCFWLVLSRYCLGDVCARCPLARRRRCFCRGLADGGRPYGTRRPALSASQRVPAVPAKVQACAAAIGHHLVSRQADAAHPAGLDPGPFSPQRDRTLLVNHDLLPSPSPGTRSGAAGTGAVHRPGRLRSGRTICPASTPRVRPAVALAPPSDSPFFGFQVSRFRA